MAQGGRPIGTFEIFIDGRLVARNAPGNPLAIDTTKLADGYHELRIVGTDSDPIETQGRLIVPFSVHNHDAQLEFKVSPFLAKLGGKFRVTRAATWRHGHHDSTEQSRPGPRTGRSRRGRNRRGDARSRPQHVASVQRGQRDGRFRAGSRPGRVSIGSLGGLRTPPELPTPLFEHRCTAKPGPPDAGHIARFSGVLRQKGQRRWNIPISRRGKLGDRATSLTACAIQIR